ncbi:PE_PGRS family protein [Actinokineospora spheciospongiae]|uniref:PE_PGRS family protein n=1 Tax=Actinokineospora spheciospongiae TaxID=909613 RepID=W7ISM3_9PSEU|nr:IniB N-terminal domain-containing protein [Actinokineospora spheciospongiae]EWC59722.1 PE_PGRS family protein [Actinokineospora spheciospongiae]PWW64742.1 hypothetical protein DFQ13_103716 [Actinokineospora spheciospongiae]
MSAQEQTLHDFVLNLLTDDAARSAFAANPTAALGDAGLGDVTAQDVQDVIPLVVDYAPVGDGQGVELAIPTDGDDAIARLQAVAEVGGAAFAGQVDTDVVTATATGVYSADEGFDGKFDVDTEQGGATTWLAAGSDGAALDTVFESDHAQGQAGVAVGTDGTAAGYADLTTEHATAHGAFAASTEGARGHLAVETDHLDSGSAFAAGFEGVQAGTHGETDFAAYEAKLDTTDGVATSAVLDTDELEAGVALDALTEDGTQAVAGVETDFVTAGAALDASTEGVHATAGVETDALSAGASLDASRDGVYATAGVEADDLSAGAALGLDHDGLQADAGLETEAVWAGVQTGGDALSAGTDLDAGVLGVEGGLDYAAGDLALGAELETPLGEVDLSGLSVGVHGVSTPELADLVDPGDLLDAETLRGGDLSAGTVADFVSAGGRLVGETADLASGAAPAGLGGFLTGATAPVSDALSTGTAPLTDGLDALDGLGTLPALPGLSDLPAELPAVPALPELSDLPAELPTDLSDLPVDLPTDLPVDVPDLPVVNPLPDLAHLPETLGGVVDASPLGDLVHGVEDALPEVGGLTDGLHLGH